MICRAVSWVWRERPEGEIREQQETTAERPERGPAQRERKSERKREKEGKSSKRDQHMRMREKEREREREREDEEWMVSFGCLNTLGADE